VGIFNAVNLMWKGITSPEADNSVAIFMQICECQQQIPIVFFIDKLFIKQHLTINTNLQTHHRVAKEIH